MARMAQRDSRTIAYVERRTAEGHSKREIIRCLKRHVAREVSRVIIDPTTPAPTATKIRSLHERNRLLQLQLGEISGIPNGAISRLERGELRRAIYNASSINPSRSSTGELDSHMSIWPNRIILLRSAGLR